MKNDIKKNVLLSPDEEIYKEFPKLKGRDYFCQVILTTKRLIIYTHGNMITQSRTTKKRGMQEIELKSINHLEYFLEYNKNSFAVRLIGFILFIGSIIFGYGIFRNLISIPAYQYDYIINYTAAGFFMLIGLYMMFRVRKVLHFKVLSGFSIPTELKLKPTKYNELALKYLASKFY
jgi:hypothetical protein